MLSSVEVLNAFLTYLQLTVDLSGWNAIINRGKSIQLDTLEQCLRNFNSHMSYFGIWLNCHSGVQQVRQILSFQVSNSFPVVTSVACPALAFLNQGSSRECRTTEKNFNGCFLKSPKDNIQLATSGCIEENSLYTMEASGNYD